MTTANEQEGSSQELDTGLGGPGPFSDNELAAVTEGPASDPELDEIDSVEISEAEAAAEMASGFEKLRAKSKKLSPERQRTVLESLLFVAEGPLTADQLHAATGIPRDDVKVGLEEIAGRMREGVSGFVLHEVGGAWQLRTCPQSAEYVRRFLQVKPQRLTRPAVETLALVAYRQPVTRTEIEDVRGVDSGAVIKALLERKLIKILGKKEDVGRPILYGTTREFLEYFSLRDLSALPTLREFHELTEEHQEIVEDSGGEAERLSIQQLQDSDFGDKLEEAEKTSAAAMDALEEAMTKVDASARSAEQSLKTPEEADEAGAFSETAEETRPVEEAEKEEIADDEARLSETADERAS